MIRRDEATILHAAALHRGEAIAAIQGTTPRPAKPGSKWGKRIATLTALVAVGAGLGFAIVWVLKFVDGPVQTTTSTSQLTKLQANASPTPTTLVMSGLYFELQYPSVFDQVGTVKNDSQSLEQYNLSSKKQYSRMIAVSVRPLPSGKLEDDSSYRLRQITPADYEPSTATAKGEPVALYTRRDRTEKTMFWAHGGKLLSVSITSNDPKDDVNVYMDVVTRGTRWRQ